MEINVLTKIKVRLSDNQHGKHSKNNEIILIIKIKSTWKSFKYESTVSFSQTLTLQHEDMQQWLK